MSLTPAQAHALGQGMLSVVKRANAYENRTQRDLAALCAQKDETIIAMAQQIEALQARIEALQAQQIQTHLKIDETMVSQADSDAGYVDADGNVWRTPKSYHRATGEDLNRVYYQRRTGKLEHREVTIGKRPYYLILSYRAYDEEVAA